MIDRVIDRIRGLQPERELETLTEHLAVTSPAALNFLARERMTAPRLEAQRLAATQLRVITELAARLRWLESSCAEPLLEPAVRVALWGLLDELVADIEGAHAAPGESIALLEPAVLFHILLSTLRPWLPPMVVALEPDAVLDMLQLGIPDYLHPVLHRRFEQLWARFHELRLTAKNEGMPTGGAANGATLPPAPTWTSPVWVSAWLEAEPRYSAAMAACL